MSGRESPRSGPLPRSGSQSPERGGEQARVPGTHATYRGFSPDLPAPPPPPPLPQRPSSASPAGGAAEPVRSPSTSPTRLAPKLAQDFTKIVVAGEPPPVVKPKKPAVKKPLDAHLPAAKLRLFCFDRTTGVPIPGVVIHITTVASLNEGSGKNFQSAFGNAAYSRSDGVCILKLLAGRAYVITATCEGFHKFGELGEYLLVTPRENERLEKAIGMVPIRISVVVTLRELQPLAARGMMQDPYGQVNPLYVPPVVDKMSVQPQKVSFTTPDGTRQTFMATTVMSHDSLKVTGSVPQPAVSALIEGHQAHMAAHQEAQQQQQPGGGSALPEPSASPRGAFGSPATARLSGAGASPSGQPTTTRVSAAGAAVVPAAAAAAGGAGTTGGGDVLHLEGHLDLPPWVTPDACTGVYSTDSEGHCFFYGPRIDAGRLGGPVRGYSYFDAGPWQYFKKYHMQRNAFSPPRALFENYPAHLPGFRSRSPSPDRSPAEQSRLDAWLSSNPDVRDMIRPPDGVSPRGRGPGRIRPRSAGANNPDGGRTDLFSLRPAHALAPRGADVSSSSGGSPLKRGWLNNHPDIEDMIRDPADAGGAGAAGAGRRRRWDQGESPQLPADPFQRHQALLTSLGVPPSKQPVAGAPYNGVASAVQHTRATYAEASGAEHASPTPSHPQAGPGGMTTTTVWGEGRALASASLASMGAMPMDPEGVHNYLHPGVYDVSVLDPSLLLIFYTYTGDKEMAEITKAQDSLVQVTMPDADPSYMAPKVEGTPEKRTTFPVQLYCRARPWFQILVYDSDTGEEIGSRYWMRYTVQRLDYTRSMKYRIARMRALMAAAGTEDPAALDPEEVDAEALAYIAKQDAKSRLAGLWARAEMQEAERLAKERAAGGPAHSVAAQPSRSGTTFSISDTERAMDEEEDRLYVPYAEGELGEDAEKVWVIPGEKYAVTLTSHSPFIELTARQTRTVGWELDPFVFYVRRKVRLLVGVRERFSQAPLVGRRVVVKVTEYPKPPRPPVVRPEWCETPATYARRVLDQLIDHIVQVRTPSYTEHVAVEIEAETNPEGIAEVAVPPEAKVEVWVDPAGDFEPGNNSDTRTLTTEAEQFMGFQLERIVFTHPHVKHAVTGEGLAGFTIKAYDVTHLVKDPPQPGASPRKTARRQRKEEEMMEEAKASTLVKGLTPIWEATTLEDGSLPAPITSRAGRVLKIIVVGTPKEYLLPEYFKPGSGTALVSTYDLHHIDFLAPPKPRVKAYAQDTCTLEHVMGVRLRVMVRYTGPTYVPEGEEKSPQQLHQEAEDAERQAKEREEREALAAAAAAAEAKAKEAADAEAATAAGATAEGSTATPLDDELSRKAKTAAGASSRAGAGRRGGRSSRQRGSNGDWDDEEEDGYDDEDLEDVDWRTGPGLTSKDKVYWDGAPVPKGAPAGTTGDMSALASDAQTKVLQQLGAMGAPGQRGAGANAGRGRQGRAPNEVGQWANGDAAALARSRMTSPSPRQGNPAGGGGFAYEPSEQGASAHGGASALSMDSFTLAEQERVAEEAARAEEDNPEEKEPWGPVWYETHTGHPDIDLDGKGLLVDAGVEVRIEVFPDWPFMTQSQVITARVDTWEDPQPWRFMLPRDDGAFRFWAERDRVLHTFYDENGAPRVPYHPLARLQPSAMPSRLVAPWHPELLLLKPAGVNAKGWGTAPGTAAGEGADGRTPQARPFQGQLPYHQRLLPDKDSDTPSGQGLQGVTPLSVALGPRTQWGTPGGQMKGGGADGDGDGSGAPFSFSTPQPKPGNALGWPGRPGAGGWGQGPGDEGEGGLHEMPSAIQFDEEGRDLDDMRAAAWAHMHLADSQYLPLERMRLLPFLVKWGAFPHLVGGFCKACSGPSPSPTTPFLMTHTAGNNSLGHNHGATHSNDGGDEDYFDEEDPDTGGRSSSGGNANKKSKYKSRLLGEDGGTEWLAAAWALQRPRNTRPRTPPHLRPHVPDKYARTHRIIATSEAIYCESPFFTWRLPNGSAVHVGVQELLYRELVPLIDRTAASVDFMKSHLAKVQAHNDTRGKHGRFLLGHKAVDGARGGLFVLDVSAAMPFDAELFILDQLGDAWDYWAAASTPPPGEGPTTTSIMPQAQAQPTTPRTAWGADAPSTPPPDSSTSGVPGAEGPGAVAVNLVVVAGKKMEAFRKDLIVLRPVEGGHGARLKGWWDEVRGKLPRQSEGVKLPETLRAAVNMASGRVPVYLIMGGLLPRFRDNPKKVSRVLYDAQLECIRREAPLQPVHTIEMYPMPPLREKKSKGLLGARTSSGRSESAAGGSVPLGFDEGEDRPSGGRQGGARGGGGDGLKAEASGDGVPAPSISLSVTSAQGADIFELLQDAMAEARVRLVDVFRELDRESKGGLTGAQLGRLLTRFVPDASPAHLRYFQLIMDSDGDSLITYKELSNTFRAANRSGLSLQLRDELEVNLLLQRLALLCMIRNKTPRELFSQYDTNSDGFLDQVEQWRMLKDVLPGLVLEEQQELFAAIQVIDVNNDERISWDEFQRAFAAGGAQQLQAWGSARDPEELKRMKEAAGGGPDEVALNAMRAEAEGKIVDATRAAGFPLTRVLAQLSGATRGRHRRLDLGHARAFAQPVDLSPLQKSLAQLEKSLAQLLAFEEAYGTQLTLERSSRPPGRPAVPGPGGGGGALVAVEPPSPAAVAAKALRASGNRDSKLVSGAELGRAMRAADREKEEARYKPGASYGKTNARPRPKSASTLYSSTASSNTRRKANGSKPNSRGATQAPTGGSQALDMGGPLATIRSSGSLNYGNSGASPSRRPQSAREPRNSSRGNNRNRGGAGEGPSEALLSPTSTSRQYAADLAARRTAPAAALLAGIPALGVPADGGALGSNSSAAPTPPPPGGLSASPSERALAAAGITGWRVTEPGGDPYPSVTPPPEPAWRASGTSTPTVSRPAAAFAFSTRPSTSGAGGQGGGPSGRVSASGSSALGTGVEEVRVTAGGTAPPPLVLPPSPALTTAPPTSLSPTGVFDGRSLVAPPARHALAGSPGRRPGSAPSTGRRTSALELPSYLSSDLGRGKPSPPPPASRARQSLALGSGSFMAHTDASGSIINGPSSSAAPSDQGGPSKGSVGGSPASLLTAAYTGSSVGEVSTTRRAGPGGFKGRVLLSERRSTTSDSLGPAWNP